MEILTRNRNRCLMMIVLAAILMSSTMPYVNAKTKYSASEEDQTSSQSSLSNFEDAKQASLDNLEVDYESGIIDISQYLLYKAWRVFDPSKLPLEYALSPFEARLYRKSGTTVIQEIRENWNNLDPETQSQLGFVFKRPTDIGGAADDQKRHLLPELYNTTNFVMHWTNGTDGGASADAVPLRDANTNRVPDYIEDFARIFEDVRGFEVGNRGFHAPSDDAAEPNDANRRNPDQRYDIFVYNMSAYGWTVPEQSSSPSYSHIEVDNDYLGFPEPPLQAMQVTAAHEFFHAIQFYYDCTEERWWEEATSTYMEDEVYPDVNDNYQYLPDWFQNCDSLGLRLFDGWHEYGDFIFAKRLSEVFGDDVIKVIWEEMVVTNGIDAINNVLVRRGSSFINEFNGFTIANLFLEENYVDGTDYREELTGETTFNGVWLQYEYNASLEADYVVIDKSNVNYKAWMNTWATDYITIKPDPNTMNYRIFFDGLDLTTNYLVTFAWKQNGNIAWKRFPLDALEDCYAELSYDPTMENLTLIISNAGNTATADPSWRVVITKLLPQMELYYDDGTPEDGLSWRAAGGVFAVRFTPSTSGRLTECSFYINNNPATVKVHVLDNRRTDLIQPFLKTPTTLGWFHVDLSAFRVAVSSGVDFYVALEWTVANAPSLGLDISQPENRSFAWDGAQWIQTTGIDFLVRAMVATETPDLMISDISWSPSIPIEGNTVTFTVDIKNRGPVNAGSLKTAYYIDGSKIGEWSITSLAAGQNITKSFTWTAVQGNHTVKAFVDSNHDVEEKVETNNEKETAFQVGRKPKPDLIISDISWVPETPQSGTIVTFTATIKNNGTANAVSFKTAYYINQTKLGEWSITSLTVGQEVNKTFTWTYVEGSHTVKAVADSNGEIQEDDETNNIREEVIGNRPPVASFGCNGYDYLSSPIAFVHKPTCFNATESNDPDGSIVSYCWDFGDGNVTTVTDPVITHNYNHIGNYSVTLNVTDNQGGLSAAVANITVQLKGDLNGDELVNILDISLIGIAYNSRPGDSNWNPKVDFDKNNFVNIIDLTQVAIEYGSKA